MNQLKLTSMLQHFFIEDIGDGDRSSEALFHVNHRSVMQLRAKEEGIFCGKTIIEIGFTLLDPTATVQLFYEDGDTMERGAVLAKVEGNTCHLLSAERVILNLVQLLSGIATATARAVEETVGTQARICDTRKTTPGLRMLEKYAVRVGGGFNHRFGLYDAVMLKDNHITLAGSIAHAVKMVRSKVGHTVKIEVEIETYEQLKEAIEANVDIIMFDNCTPEQIKRWLLDVPPHITTEASGGIDGSSIHAYAKTGVEWISIGALTHSVKAVDISAEVVPL